MMGLFKKIYLHVRFYPNEIEVIDLAGMRSVRQKSVENFSNERLIIADFHIAEKNLSQIIKDVIGKKHSLKRVVCIIQQKYDLPGGLTEVEKRAYRDVADHAGALEVHVVQDSSDYTRSELLSYREYAS